MLVSMIGQAHQDMYCIRTELDLTHITLPTVVLSVFLGHNETKLGRITVSWNELTTDHGFPNEAHNAHALRNCTD